MNTFTTLASESAYPFISKSKIKEWILSNNFKCFRLQKNYDETGQFSLNRKIKNYALSPEYKEDI